VLYRSTDIEFIARNSKTKSGELNKKKRGVNDKVGHKPGHGVQVKNVNVDNASNRKCDVIKVIEVGISEGLKDIYLNVIEALIKNGSLNVTKIAKELGKSSKTVERYVSYIKEIGAIEYEGSKKAGGFRVTYYLLKRK